MKFDLVFEEQVKSIDVHFDEAQIIDDGGYERGYAAGYAAGYEKATDDFSTNVSTLPKFSGISTENENEFYYTNVSVNSVWVDSNIIKFEGEENKQYLIRCEVKCGTCDNFGIGFRYDDGSTTLSARYTNSDYNYVCVLSSKCKKVVGIGYSYGVSGDAYVRNFYIQELP